MSEEKKTVELKDNELEKVNGGLGRDKLRNISLTAGYYTGSYRYIYLPNNCSGIGAHAVNAIVYILKSDGYLHKDIRSVVTFANVADMQKVSPENVPPIYEQ